MLNINLDSLYIIRAAYTAVNYGVLLLRLMISEYGRKTRLIIEIFSQ